MDIINISDRKKILLADDSATIRKVIELTFADEGIDVYSVADGDAAMKKFVEIDPDLVIPGAGSLRECLRRCPQRGLQRVEVRGEGAAA